MELLYLWIENDGMTIKNQSFNFSNHINFNFEKKSESAGQLILRENSNFISNFFGNSMTLLQEGRAGNYEGGIVNVTGIIGENGVGKTNILSYLTGLLTNNSPIGETYIAAFKDEQSSSIKIFYAIENFELTTSGSVSGFNIEQPVERWYTRSPGVGYIRKDARHADNTSLIYYSPVFDLRNYPPKISNEFLSYIDVSTNGLIDNDVIGKGDTYPEGVDKLELHKSSNIRRQFDMLINSGLAEMGGVNIPTEMNIIFHREYFNPDEGQRYLMVENIIIFKHLAGLLDEAWKLVNSTLSSFKRDYGNDDNSKNTAYRRALAEKLKIEFTYSFINNFFHNLSKQYHEDISIKLEEIKGTGLFERATYFFEHQQWQSRKSNTTVQTGLLYITMLKLIDGVDFNKNWIEDDAKSFVTNIPGAATAIINYEDYILSIPSDNKKNFILISWRNLSSGENALMDLYSRLFFAKNNRLKVKEQEKQRPVTFLYILIDEGEIGFHPQWQSQYLFNLTSFVSLLFAEYKVQIILTSHSPFIVSDLPKDNLIFLEKEKGLCKVVTFNEEQTFGANIHALLSDQFFMRDGVMGKFAQTKLKSELKPLLDNDQRNLDVDRLRKIIALMGEPVLKSKLTEILNAKETNDNV